VFDSNKSNELHDYDYETENNCLGHLMLILIQSLIDKEKMGD